MQTVSPTTTCPSWCVEHDDGDSSIVVHNGPDLGGGIRLLSMTGPDGAVLEPPAISCDISSDRLTAEEAGGLSQVLLRASNWLTNPDIAAKLDAGDVQGAAQAFIDRPAS